MENLLKNIEILREKLLKAWEMLEIEKKERASWQKRKEMNRPDFWQSREQAIKISKEAEDLDKEIKIWQELKKEITELEELVAVGQEEEDFSIEEEANKKYRELKEKFEKEEFLFLFSEKYDQSGAIVSLHAGTGGVDAQDWTQMLERMYLRFAENKNWKVEIVERITGNEAGLKSSTFNIKGRWAYGYLKSESGVHRLVRISPFDAEAMRHTSFALVEIIPELPETEDLEIREEDLKIDAYRSSGPGGQGVNTTDSAVRITHQPTGLAAACQTQRSQHQNKETALRLLKAKLRKLDEENKEKEARKLKGEAQKAEWGKQIRSYVLQPYKLVKDHRTGFETSEVDKVLDGNLAGFMEAYLRKKVR